MAESSLFWTTNGTGDGISPFTAAQLQQWFSDYWIASGAANSQCVLYGLQVLGVASPLTLNSGAAQVNGVVYKNTTNLSLTVTTPGVGTTAGYVALRWDSTAQTVRAIVVRAADGVSVVPSAVRTATQFDAILATFLITTGGVITLTLLQRFLPKPIQILDYQTPNGFLVGATGGAVSNVAIQSGVLNGPTSLTFAQAFTYGTPMVFITNFPGSTAALNTVSASGFTVTGTGINCNWLAIGLVLLNN